jgi:hypothetical protein
MAEKGLGTAPLSRNPMPAKPILSEWRDRKWPNTLSSGLAGKRRAAYDSRSLRIAELPDCRFGAGDAC